MFGQPVGQRAVGFTPCQIEGIVIDEAVAAQTFGEQAEAGQIAPVWIAGQRGQILR
jgi:acetoacetate decarboxylase